ncbi:hypothetical protein GCM10008922_26470 [Faecalicatena contorta]|uniref:DUF1648 domain-containing protein n=1 Tax=Faecalicatena contorta TaxID=39482 RepID=UPI0031DD23D8
MDKKTKLPSTRYHRAVNLLCIAAMAAVFLYLIINWNHIPDQIPGHYNGAGEIDRWGNKSELWFTPILSVLMYLGISLCERTPGIWNTGVEVTRENKVRIFRIIKNMIVTMKLVMVLTFVFLSFYSALTKPLPAWFLPVDMILVFGPMAFFLIQLYRKR